MTFADTGEYHCVVNGKKDDGIVRFYVQGMDPLFMSLQNICFCAFAKCGSGCRYQYKYIYKYINAKILLFAVRVNDFYENSDRIILCYHIIDGLMSAYIILSQDIIKYKCFEFIIILYFYYLFEFISFYYYFYYYLQKIFISFS